MVLSIQSCVKTDSYRRINTSFNQDWKFQKGEQGSEQNIDFNDSEWRKLNLPHDWAIEGPFDIKYNARSGGLPFHGTGWYRKHFYEGYKKIFPYQLGIYKASEFVKFIPSK